MSFKKERRPVIFDRAVRFNNGAGTSTGIAATSTGSLIMEEVQTLTGASTGTAITPYGLTFITVTTGQSTAADLTFTMGSPGKAGIHKRIIADLNSTKTATVRTASSLGTFYGTTKNSITFTTGSTHAGTAAHLVSYSSVRWALLSLGAPLANSTAVTNFRATIAAATA